MWLSQPRPPGTVGTSTIASVPFPVHGLILMCPPVCTIKSEPQTQPRTSACSLLLGNALWGASVGQDGPQGCRAWRSIWLNALPLHPLGASAFPASCSSSCFSLGPWCGRCEGSNAPRVAQPFISLAEQSPGPLLLPLLFPESERERERERWAARVSWTICRASGEVGGLDSPMSSCYLWPSQDLLSWTSG